MALRLISSDLCPPGPQSVVDMGCPVTCHDRKAPQVNNGAYAKNVMAAAVMGLASLSIAACATTVVVPTADSTGGASSEVAVTASDTACHVSSTQAPVGTRTFVVTNTGTKTTAFYVYGTGDRVVGAVENIAPGLQRNLVVSLDEPGRYQMSCRPGMLDQGLRSSFTVTGDVVPMSADAKFKDAADGYKRYLITQTDALVATTTAFVGAIKKGDVVGAEASYPAARAYYQRTRSAAASFPDDLIMRIGLREADLDPGQQWSGFHRLEKDLWVSGLRPDTNVIADQLLADVKELNAEVKSPTWRVDSIHIAAGAQNVLQSVAAYMISGADEAFSHTDLWSFAASVDGARAAVASVRPILDDRDANLGAEVDAQFDAVEEALSKHRDKDGFVFYDKVTSAERDDLAHAVQALAALVGRVQNTIAG